MPNDVLTVVDLARYLKLDRQTVYRKFRREEIPGVRIGRAIRFSRAVIDGWMRAESYRRGPRERAALRAWAGRFAARQRIREKDVVAAVRGRRKRTR